MRRMRGTFRSGERTLGSLLAASALLGLILLSTAAAAPVSTPLDSPPILEDFTIDPTLVMPGPVRLRAVGIDDTTPIGFAEFWIDDFGGPIDGMLVPEAPFPYTTTGVLVWEGSWDDFTSGWHTITAIAVDINFDRGTSPASVTFFVANATHVGPAVSSVDAAPVNVSLGSATTISATFEDPFPGGSVSAAEYFLGEPGADGTGIPIAATYGTSSVSAVWSEPVVPPIGARSLYVHARNEVGTWGDFASVRFTALGPMVTLSLEADRATAVRGELVTLAVSLSNAGNAPATSVSVQVVLPPSLRHESDTSAAVGGVRTGDTYEFTDLAPGAYPFTIHARVADDATDGTPIGATATVSYTNDGGWIFPSVAAVTGGTVVAPELEVELRAPSAAHPGEALTWTLHVRNVGSRTLPAVDIGLDATEGVDRIGDDFASAGAIPTGASSWRLPALPVGDHVFLVEERVEREVVASGLIGRQATASYVARDGARRTVLAGASVPLTGPSLSLLVRADVQELVPGETAILTLSIENQGAASAGTVSIDLALPPSLALAGGLPPSETSGHAHTWRLSGFAPGSQDFQLVLSAREPARVPLTFTFAYTSPNGVPLDRAFVPVLFVVGEAPVPPEQITIGFGLLAVSIGAAGYVATERGKTALLSLLFVPLYTRLVREKVLDNETRGMIRGYILANPGDHYNAIKETLELPNGTLSYHITVLEKERLVRSVKDGKFRRYYPYEMRLPEGGEPTKIQKVVLDLIRANPGITPRDAATLLGITASTVSYHLEKLKELDRIEYRREGISKRLYVRDGNGP